MILDLRHRVNQGKHHTGCRKEAEHTTTEDEGAMLDDLGRTFPLAIRLKEVLVDSRALDVASVILHKLKI